MATATAMVLILPSLMSYMLVLLLCPFSCLSFHFGVKGLASFSSSPHEASTWVMHGLSAMRFRA